MSLLVKICGVNSQPAAEAVLNAGADFAGLVFYARSPRNLSLTDAAPLAGLMRGRLRLVALMVDPDDAAIDAVLAAIHPDYLQLHGQESAGRIGDIRARFGVHIIKAVTVAEAADLDDAAALMQAADMLLFDARPPRGAARTGGNGVAFDWNILSGRSFPRPWLLAGGLTPANVTAAAYAAGAGMVDVSSGVESAPGVKDPDKIAAFVAAAHNFTPSHNLKL
ncbi:MAG: phosphoribosylanthranilate isomerase [Rhizomicrobium sp.]